MIFSALNYQRLTQVHCTQLSVKKIKIKQASNRISKKNFPDLNIIFPDKIAFNLSVTSMFY